MIKSHKRKKMIRRRKMNQKRSKMTKRKTIRRKERRVTHRRHLLAAVVILIKTRSLRKWSWLTSHPRFLNRCQYLTSSTIDTIPTIPARITPLDIVLMAQFLVEAATQYLVVAVTKIAAQA